MTFHKILAPLDGSRFAEAALPKAMELLSNNPDASLILLRAVEARTFPGVDPIDAQVSVVHEAEEYLETVAARLRKDGVSKVRTSVWYGAAAPAILEAARTANPDLIMMSTHGRSGIGRLIAGSVAAPRSPYLPHLPRCRTYVGSVELSGAGATQWLPTGGRLWRRRERPGRPHRHEHHGSETTSSRGMGLMVKLTERQVVAAAVA